MSNYRPKVVFKPPEPRILNEAFGSMSLSQYNKAVKETPKWKFLLYYFLPFVTHPYSKYNE